MVRRRGFTLVELLVVIGIMVMLMTLVLPSFQRVRLMAKRAACGSNLRQLIIAINTYAGENKGLLPPHRLVPGTSPNPARWWGIDQESRDLGEQPYGELFVYADNPGVFHCPAILTEAAEAGAEYDWAFTAREVGYGYNAFFLGWHGGTPDPTPALAGPPDNQVLPDVRTNISFMVDASKTVVFADSAVRNTPPQDSYVTWWPSMSWSADDGSNFVGPYTRHLKRANLVMLDGGVRLKYDEEMYDAGGEGPRPGLRQLFDHRYPRPGDPQP